MTWRDRFRRREGWLENLWSIPVLGAVLGALLGVAIPLVDEHLDPSALGQYSPSTASALLTAIVGAAAALTGFVVTVTVLVVQMATGTFSARILRLWYRDPLLKATLAVLMGTLVYSFSLLRQIDDEFVPDVGVTLAGVAISLCLLVFIVFFDQCTRQLRPVAVAAEVARAARVTFAETVRLADRADIRWGAGTERTDPAHIVRADRGGAIQAVDADGLVQWADAHGGELVVSHPVGDFVHTGGELARVYGGDFDEAAGDEIKGLIALGDERTFDQDPAFGLRIMVDIANRALSPAVNDPTTAVQVLDHIGEVLAFIGTTDLEERARTATGDTSARVVLATRRWDDYVTLALTEIREFGATSIQVMRRLRAVLEQLVETVRPEHRAAVVAEVRRLDATVAASWTDSIDLDLANTADRQGIGGTPDSPGR